MVLRMGHLFTNDMIVGTCTGVLYQNPLKGLKISGSRESSTHGT